MCWEEQNIKDNQSIGTNWIVCIKVFVPRENPRILSVFWVRKSADFHGTCLEKPRESKCSKHENMRELNTHQDLPDPSGIWGYQYHNLAHLCTSHDASAREGTYFICNLIPDIIFQGLTAVQIKEGISPLNENQYLKHCNR